MSLQPTSEQWQALQPVERFNFKVTHSMNSSPIIRPILTRIAVVLGGRCVEIATSNIVLDHGFENFEKIDPNKGVLLVVNHRTFYDQFVIYARLLRLFGTHRNAYYPVRANFFYDNPLGLFVNLPFALGGMYPPIIRDKKRLLWNQYATDLMAELVKSPANMVGFHPEGTRNRGPDPYALLPGKPGCGELIFRSNPNVVPVFLQGFMKSPFKMVQKNWSSSPKPVVHMVMGEPLDFSEEGKLEENRKTFLLISKKVMGAIGELAKREQDIRAKFEGKVQETALQ